MSLGQSLDAGSLYNSATQAGIILDDNPNKYPHPFLTMSDLFIPDNIHEIFKLCRHFAFSNEIIAPIINKLSEAPVTHLVYEGSGSDESENRYKELFEEKLDLRKRLTESIFDQSVYGNGFLSLGLFPTRYLVCRKCKEDHAKKRVKGENEKPKYNRYLIRQISNIETKVGKNDSNSKLNDLHIYGMCPVCKIKVRFDREDVIRKDTNKLKIIRWDPNHVTISRINTMDYQEYYYDIPLEERKVIRTWSREILESIPWAYVQAVVNDVKLKIPRKHLFHFKTVTFSGQFPGWGMPKMAAALKALYYYITLQRGNESVARGKIQDLTLFYPNAATGVVGGASHLFGQLKDVISSFQKGNKNGVGYINQQVGVQSVFGNGRQLLITGELDLQIRNICAVMGITIDLLHSNAPYASMAMSTRMLMNQYDLSREEINECIQFMVKSISSVFPSFDKNIEVRLEANNGPDSLSKTQLLANMKQMGVIVSDDTLLEGVDVDAKSEINKAKKELRGKAKITEESTLLQAHAQAKANKEYMKSELDAQEEAMRTQQEIMAGGQEGVVEEGLPENLTEQDKLAIEKAQELAGFYQNDDAQNAELLIQKLSNEDPYFLQLVLAYFNMITGVDLMDGSRPIIDDMQQPNIVPENSIPSMEIPQVHTGEHEAPVADIDNPMGVDQSGSKIIVDKEPTNKANQHKNI